MSFTATKKKSFIPVNRFVLRAGCVLEFDAFASSAMNSNVRSLPKGTEFSGDLAKNIENSPDLKLYVRPVDLETYWNVLDRQLEQDSNVNESSLRDSAFSDLIRGTHCEALDSLDTATIYTSAGVNGLRIARWFSLNPNFTRILDSLSPPNTWYEHALNSAILSSYFAYSMGATEKVLANFAQATLLADIGMLDVDQELLNSTSNLLPGQIRKLEAHANFGFKRLAQIETANWMALMIVYQHHERPDRKGYPVGIPEDLISDGAKMYSIVDRFLIHCGKRFPLQPSSITEAIDLLEAESGTLIAEEHFQCWKSIVLKNL
jgi:HD-GYP domain-containing protein (c-di-GMP phosphodiesterase class II)